MIEFTHFTEAHREDLDELLGLYVTSFLLWKTKTSYRRTLPIADAFPVWWLMRGPTGFRTADDAQYFKTLLLARIEAEAPDAPSA